MASDDDMAEEEVILCSDCFQNQGLILDARRLGIDTPEPCPHCRSQTGAKLTSERVLDLAHRFFSVGSFVKSEFGGAPAVVFNGSQASDIDPGHRHSHDAELISAKVGVGFFYYGPRLWMLGQIEPLEQLQDPATRSLVIDRILREYPERTFGLDQIVYRLRKDVAQPDEPGEYDSAPLEFRGEGGRLDLEDLAILYASPDLEICVHECRVTAEDRVHVATLKPTRDLRLLDLTAVHFEEDVTEFESLDLAVHMTFLAGRHAYPITRAIAAAARDAGFDGLLFPSFFSLLRTGSPFLETVYGLSTRRLPGAAERESSRIIKNIGLFGHPVADGRMEVSCINQLYIRQVAYDLGFGPSVI
ncbi:RES family NAD+ phosphorylase [Methylobacterium sp. A52T]